jgi:hypothetical protein
MGGSLVFLLSIFISVSSFAAAPKCEELTQDLKAMQAAQHQLLSTLGQRNDMMATVLDQSAEKLEKIMSRSRTLRKSDLSVLHVSARTFRSHEKRESVLIEKFEKASAELLNQVETCLASSNSLEKLGQR